MAPTRIPVPRASLGNILLCFSTACEADGFSLVPSNGFAGSSSSSSSSKNGILKLIVKTYVDELLSISDRLDDELVRSRLLHLGYVCDCLHVYLSPSVRERMVACTSRDVRSMACMCVCTRV